MTQAHAAIAVDRRLGWPPHPVGRVDLREVEPDLVGLDADPGTVALSVFRLPRGPMPVAPEPAPGNHPGYLLLKGLVLYEVRVCGRVTADLLGPGDQVRPYAPHDAGTLATTATWTILETALLGDLRALGRLRPERSQRIFEGLLDRSATHAELLAIERTIAAQVRVDVRLLAYLWHLADRFGVVVPGAVRMTLPLTHNVLARLVGARRPTVTTALQRLMRLGYLERDGQAFLLLGDSSAVDDLERQPAEA